MASTSNKPRLAFKWGFTLAELLVSLGVLGLIAGLTIPSIVTNVEKGKRQALIKEGFQAISSIVQAGYMNGDFDDITSWDIVNQKGTGSIVDYFNQKLNATYRCNTNDTSKGCGKYMSALLLPNGTRPWSSPVPWNHNAVWIMPSRAMYWIHGTSRVDRNRIEWDITSDAYAADLFIGGKNPSTVILYCNLSDTPNNPYNVKPTQPGNCDYVNNYGLDN